jgi:DMSO reductase anchor subunit
LFDSGHSSENFLQREFIYQVGIKTTRLARLISVGLAFILPIACLSVMALNQFVWGLALFAVVGHYFGLLLERWLFFIEAKHVVRHYYGE